MKTWAVESLLTLRDDEDLFPAPFADMVEMAGQMAMCDEAQAERNVWEALRRQEVTAHFDDELNLLLSFGPNAASGKGRWAELMRDRISKGGQSE